MDQSYTRSTTDGTKRVKTGLSDTSDVFQQIFSGNRDMARGIHDLRHRLGCSRHSKIRGETRRQSHERYHSKRHPRSDPISKALSERCLSNYIRVVKETIMVAPNI